MKKLAAWVLLSLLAVALISSCGSRRGDKCPGIGQMQTEQNFA